jgi:hypothetical protein
LLKILTLGAAIKIKQIIKWVEIIAEAISVIVILKDEYFSAPLTITRGLFADGFGVLGAFILVSAFLSENI